MNKQQYLETAAAYRHDAAIMTSKADTHRGMKEEAHYRFYAQDSLKMAALMEERAKEKGDEQ